MNYEIHSENAHLERIRRMRRISRLLSQLCTEYEEAPDSVTVASIKQWATELADTARTFDVSHQYGDTEAARYKGENVELPEDDPDVAPRARRPGLAAGAARRRETRATKRRW